MRVQALEAEVEQLKKRLAEPWPQGGGWERVYHRVTRTGDSRSTIERDIRSGLLEVKRDGRRTYVRDKLDAPAKRRRGRPPGSKSEVVGLPATTGPAGPQWPFVSTKEPPSAGGGS
jgi:hypothetical protein